MDVIFPVFFWDSQPLRIVRALPMKRCTWANLRVLLLLRNYFSHITKPFTEVINFITAREEICSYIPDPLNPPEVCFLALTATSNRKERTCWETTWLEFFWFQSLMSAHTQLLWLGVSGRQSWMMQSIFQMFAQWRIAIIGSGATVFRKQILCISRLDNS